MDVNIRSGDSKKRKANDGHAIDGDYTSSGHHDNVKFMKQTLSHMERMEKVMTRMEEKLATVNSLESRCEQLEAKCSSLENTLTSTLQLVKNHVCSHTNSIENKLEGKVDALHVKVDRALKLNAMLARNQSWDYSAEINSYDWLDDAHQAAYLVKLAEKLKNNTIQLRRGEFPHNDEGKGILLCNDYDDSENLGTYASDELLPHWKEFAAAVEQFAPAIELLPDDCESYFEFGQFRLKKDTMMLIKEALMSNPFTTLVFYHDNEADYEDGGMSTDDILDIAESNKHLRNLGIYHNRILNNHIDRICSLVNEVPLVSLDLIDSLNPGIGNAVLTALLSSGELKLEKLCMEFAHITSDVSGLLANFLSTSTKLKELALKNNMLNDSDAALIANALRTNTTLWHLDLRDNNITDIGFEAFRSVLYDRSSLNAVADSNHCCSLDEMPEIDFNLNSYDMIEENRGRKIYFLLSERHKTSKNVQHFSSIDVKILPRMLEAVQSYSKIGADDEDESHLRVGSLSILYEVMRDWEKVLNFFTSHHDARTVSKGRGMYQTWGKQTIQH